MNKRTIVASLNKIANELDNSGLYAEANEITNVMMRLSQLESIFLGGLGGQKGAEFMKGKNFPYNPSGGPSFPKNPYAKDSGFDKEPVRRDLEIPFNPSGGMIYPPRGGGKKTTPSIPSESEEKPGSDRPIFERYL